MFGQKKRIVRYAALKSTLMITPGKDCSNYTYCHGAHKYGKRPRNFAKGGGRMVIIEMKLFDLDLVICHFSWQICQHSIVKIAFNFAKAVLGRPWLPYH